MQEVWRDGNRFTLLPEGRRFMPAIIAAIGEAQEFLLIEQYLVRSGKLSNRIIEALIDACGRGVRVMFLLDDYGAQGFAQEDRQRLEAAGVVIRFFNPLALGRLTGNLTRDHRKLVVVDQQAAYTGGFCLIDEFDTWYDLVIRAEGPVVVDWTRLFCRLWNSAAARNKHERARLPVPTSRSAPPRFLPGMRGRVIWSRGYRHQAIRRSLYERIAGAQRRLWLCTPYFAPTLGLRQRLMEAANRGVDVRLLLPGREKHDHPGVQYAGQRFYMRLLAANIRIFEFQPAFIHAKFCLADDWCTVGSCNFDHWSLKWNLESNQEVDDPLFAGEVEALFERNFSASREIDPVSWARRPRLQRILEWLYGRVSAWLTRLS